MTMHKIALQLRKRPLITFYLDNIKNKTNKTGI